MNKGKQNLFQFLLVDTFGYGRTGLLPMVKISKDGGAFAVTTNTATQVSAADAPGLYQVVLTDTECACDVLAIAITLSNGDMPAVLVQIELSTVPPTVEHIQSGLATSSALAAMQTHGDTTWAKTPAADIAESVLVADVSTAAVTATPDSLAGVILAMFHSTIGTDGTWTIYKGDDTTPFAVKTVLPSANATPIVGVANSEG